MSQYKTSIRPLQYEDLGDFWEVHDGYYPNDKTNRVEWFNKLNTELPDFSYYGAFRDGKMMGGMAIGNFELNVRSQIIKLSSVGMIRTDMLHKKEKICKDMMEYFIEDNRRKGIHMLTLTPFRPDFYKQMGFGYGSCLYNYRIPPSSFPNSCSKELLSFTSRSEKQAIIDCYNRVCKKTHGAICTAWFLGMFEAGKRILVCKTDGIIRGVLVFSSANESEMVIENLFYEETEVLQAFCAFLHSQIDEFDRILFSTPDEYFYYLLHDPTDGIAKNENCTSVINNMFRVIDVAGLFGELHNVNFNNQTAVLELSVRDTFYPQNSGITVVAFTNGKASVCSNQSPINASIKMELDISDFSSLIMGAVNVKTLYHLGLLKISDTNNLDTLESIFMIGQKPQSNGGL